ncbi:hemin uptake protein HemP [Acidovorax radicis]|uniref:hemin uptake protein HemP n=1 Tax=Acidovorax radicis TaxID=758826 RepID=UPI001CFA24E6|nr:hemin uptake protein HemP [Acidovorax radicis]UCV01044.1 hemin uptake protein HemP [Acidovorax radicis]
MQATTMTSASLLRPGHAENAAAQRPIDGGTGTSPAELAVDSSALLQGQKAVSISHNGSVYRLQATKLGKLILTK